MALDQSGNYYADLPDEKRGTGCSSATKHGHGAPTPTTPISSIYIDDDTGDLYVNTSCNFAGWTLVTGGGGSSSVTHGAGTPIANNVSVVTYKIYINDNNGALWAVSNGVWTQITADSEA